MSKAELENAELRRKLDDMTEQYTIMKSLADSNQRTQFENTQNNDEF